MSDYFRLFVARRIRFNWKTGAFLIAIFTVSRFVLVLYANATKSYQAVPYIFGAMLALPLILLARPGRQKIGLVWPTRWWGVLLGALLGIASCAALFYLTVFFFGFGEGNSLVYIARSYANLPSVLNEHNRLTYFLIYAGISMGFSPLGEEVFYRGLIHECFAQSVGNRKAALVDSAAFALVHVAHFGLVYSGHGWHLLAGPTLLWVAGLFITCLLFSVARAKSGSIVGAVVAHALFNLTMNYCIFYRIL
ncbi:hypothetical protein GCM10022409_35740 [Hymenobacter glaciei]|uniref:CAAX prenyl protease 2/Lysostaphin resistance protein A-like domain-containing protein n=1 Tax=Hymenobacter glaciei TaxID=877209 RepID=A0ABP7UL37_9BACT